jgi:heme O synthase-like polyprenyltransferase
VSRAEAKPAAVTPERAIPLGALATVVGIVVCMLLDQTLGGLLVVLGVLSQAWGLHRLGRGSSTRNAGS